MSDFASKSPAPHATSDPARALPNRVPQEAAADPTLAMRLKRMQSGGVSVTGRELAGLQRTVGNQASKRLLAGRRVVGPTVPRGDAQTRAAIQRAIGFEFEFGQWTTSHNDEAKSPLAKGEEIIKGKGYKVEGEDADGRSAIEVVTKPYSTVGEATASIGKARTTLEAISNKGEGRAHNASEWAGSPNVLIEPKGVKGKMQASPAIALDKLSNLYAKQAEIGKGGKALGTSVQQQLNDDAIKTKYLDSADASPELVGLVTLIIDYLEQGSGKGTLSYPKSAFKIMARTSFDKMFALVPEHAFFAKKENQEKWVNMVLDISSKIFGKELYDEKTMRKFEIEQDVVTPKTVLGFKSFFGIKFGTKTTKQKVDQWFEWRERKERAKSVEELGAEPVLGQVFNDIEPLAEDKQSNVKPEYKLEITRKDWLAEMFTRDLISKANDKRFEGMGAYGASTDVAVDDTVVQKGAEQATEKAVDDLNLKQSVKSGGSGKEQPKAKKQAPIFELRGMRDLLEIDQDVNLTDWEEKATKLFKVVDEVNGGTFDPGGKPEVPPDTTNRDLWKKTT
jgi:hypothetical protein